MIIKKTLLIAVCAASLPAYALPTYEPFTEYSSLVGATSVDLATSGFYLTNGPVVEQWGGGSSGFGLFFAQTSDTDVLVTNNPATVFTSANLSALLPGGFPGAGGDINITAYVPQNTGASHAGNSAVLKFAQDIPRPTNGVKTIYVSYLLDVTGNFSAATGANAGRYAGFLSQTNIFEGAGSGGAYATWTSMFNTFGTGPTYVAYGEETNKPSVAGGQGDNICPADSSTGVGGTGASGARAVYNTANFVVGCFTFTTGGSIKDTNTVWINPPLADFGGPASSTNNISVFTMGTVMSDVDAFFLESRSGGATGGVGPTFIGNLLIGATWSYVTGGPEFTTQPTSENIIGYGGNAAFSAVAVAAGQTVSYQWQKVTAGTTNNLSDGTGAAGGSAVLSGSASSNLIFTGVSAGDSGIYQLVAAAGGTSYTLASSQAVLSVSAADPGFALQPAPATVNYGATAMFSAGAVTATSSMTYQWYLGATPLANGAQADGSTISGAGGAVTGSSLSTTLTISGATYQERGNYTLWATNAAGASGSSTPALLTVNDPYIVSQPSVSSVAVPYGAATNFTFAAGGSSLSYQWLNPSGPVGNTGDITGAATTNLHFSGLTFTDAGAYYAVAAGPGGSVTSAVVAITVQPITSQPPGAVTVSPGGATNISVGVAGPGLTFQWQTTNGSAVSADFSGATTTNLTIANAQPSDEGIYNVIVTYPNGAQTSAPVILYVQQAAVGPFPATNWPATVDNNTQVTYVVLDANAASDTPDFVAPANWVANLSLPASSGDQTFTTGTPYNGLQGDTFTGTYLNIADSSWQRFANYPVIDILLQVWGNSSMYNNTNGGLPIGCTEGQLWQGGYNSRPGPFPLGANNAQWNWMLIEVANPVDSTVDSSPYVISGAHIVGDTGNPTQSSSGGGKGGINNGTLRLDGFAVGGGFTVRAIAVGPQGAFGTTNEINRFAVPANCAPEPAANLVYVDFNQGITSNLTVNNNPDAQETYQVVSGGPAGDVRTAIQATSQFMEFPILNNALGQPCNEDLTMQLCIEFYDDPALAGEQFGPYAYATDPYGDIGFVPGYPNTYNQAFYTLTGTGKWLKVDWFVGPANLAGLNVAPLTGGPLVYWGLAGNPPLIDRIELGVVRTGTNALAGQVPDPSYNIDPFICDTNNNTNGYYAEWDPSRGISNNLTTAAGYTTTVTGPANDQRAAEAPNAGGSAVWYEQFLLLNDAFGPVLQDNSDVAMIVTYYDDPARAGNTLFVNVIDTMTDGNLGITSPSGANTLVTLQGTGKWLEAYFEVSNANFSATTSFSSAPGFFCRYASSAPIYISRVRYNVIRPCGQYEGIDYLQGTVGIAPTNGGATLNWRGSAALLGAPVVNGTYTNVVTVTNNVINNYPVPATNNAGFFKLQFPSYPTNLSPSTPSP